MPTLPQVMESAAASYGMGKWSVAEQLCRWVLARQSTHFEALNLLGIIAAQTRRAPEAAGLLERAVAAKPDDARARNNYGNVLKSLHRWEEALQCYDRALQIRPDYAEAYLNKGIALQGLGRFDEALECHERALRINPDFADAYNNRGIALQALNRLDEALGSYDRALQINPDYVEAHTNRGNTLRDLKRFAEALECYERPLQIRPNFAEAYVNRGNTLRDLGRFTEALECYERAVQIQPDFAEAHSNRGTAFKALQRLDEALESYSQALRLKPGCAWLQGTWLHTKMRLCEWSNLQSEIAAVLRGVSQGRNCALPFAVLALTDSAPLQRQAAQIWVRETCPANPVLPPLGKHPRGRRIRLGYYSADYHEHATAYLAAQLFELHHRDRFEVVAFSFGPEQHDPMRARLSAAFDQFWDVRGLSDREVALRSRELQIDIAVDLKGFTQDARPGIFACRAAPLQVSYLGYPGTMSAPYVDYLIADPTLIAAGEQPQYAEKIVYLPHSYQVNDRRRPIAERVFSRAELGLPPTGFVFCCFNNSYKITPEIFSAWMRILQQVPGSVLWLLADSGTTIENLRREAVLRGVSAERLIFAPRLPLPEHLARHRAADLFLDTLPYNAHTTASDALWAGLPVLTRMGASFAARVGASLLRAIGLPELITQTGQQYESLAIELATQPQRLQAVRAKLDTQRLSTPLFDTERFTRQLENAYTQIYERSQADLTPEHLYVAS